MAFFEPTRNEYLLDLCLSNVAGCSASVQPSIADHKGILASFKARKVETQEVAREIWVYKAAQWNSLQTKLANYDWRCLERGDAVEAVNLFLHIMWWCLVQCIQQKRIHETKRSHPWINARCEQAICSQEKKTNLVPAMSRNGCDACKRWLMNTRSL